MKRNKPIVQNCLICNKEFKTWPSRIKDGKGKFCSKLCSKINRNKSIEFLNCAYCGKKYRHQKSQRGYKFCSLSCFKLSFNKDKVTKICKYCHKSFIATKARIQDDRAKYCSRICYIQSMKISIELIKKHKLENTRKYRHEHPEWCAEIKHKRRATQSLLGGHFTAKEWRSLKEKYNFTCPICNNSEPTIKLTVDHVVPLKKWEVWSKENKPQYEWNSITNIQPLCGSCNSQKWMTI